MARENTHANGSLDGSLGVGDEVRIPLDLARGEDEDDSRSTVGYQIASARGENRREGGRLAKVSQFLSSLDDLALGLGLDDASNEHGSDCNDGDLDGGRSLGVHVQEGDWGWRDEYEKSGRETTTYCLACSW